MKKITSTIALTLAIGLSVVFCTSNVRADVIYGNHEYSTYGSSYSFHQSQSVTTIGKNGKETKSVVFSADSGDPYYGGNYTTGQTDLMLFCLDLQVNTSDNFKNGTGHEYTAYALEDSPTLNAAQKGALQSLFNHVYSVVENARSTWWTARLSDEATGGTDYRSTERVAAWDAYDQLSIALQFACWEIIHETSGTWAYGSGSFVTNLNSVSSYSPSVSLGNSAINTLFANMIDGWFTGIATDVWAEQFASSTDFELTYFLAESNPSQPFISATGVNSPAATPEPASMLIFGLGLVGIPFLRRKKRQA